MPTDEDLVQSARDGDVSAVGLLFDRYRAPLYAVALSVLQDPDEAQDAVQDAFLVALSKFHELRDPSAAGGWLRSIVRNNCLMRLRTRRHLSRSTHSGTIPVTMTSTRPSTGSP